MIKHYIIILWCLAFWGGFITGKSVIAGDTYCILAYGEEWHIIGENS